MIIDQSSKKWRTQFQAFFDRIVAVVATRRRPIWKSIQKTGNSKRPIWLICHLISHRLGAPVRLRNWFPPNQVRTFWHKTNFCFKLNSVHPFKTGPPFPTRVWFFSGGYQFVHVSVKEKEYFSPLKLPLLSQLEYQTNNFSLFQLGWVDHVDLSTILQVNPVVRKCPVAWKKTKSKKYRLTDSHTHTHTHTRCSLGCVPKIMRRTNQERVVLTWSIVIEMKND